MIYHETLGEAITQGHKNFTDRKAIVTDRKEDERFVFGGLAYGETKEAHYPIETLKGKSTKKYAHMTIYRMESGRYELTTYIL